ncbi:MAG: MFS transporter [Actinoplanes sp.]
MSFTSDESRWTDVYLAAGARGVSVCGDFLAATTLALVLQQSGHGGLAVSGLMLAASLPLALLAPLTGRLADRVDSRKILVGAGLAQAVTCLVLAFTTHPVLIIALVALLACGLATTQPANAALVPEMVRPDDLAKAGGLTQTAGVLGMLVGPALAGLLVGQAGARPALLIDAASYLAVVVAAVAIKTRRRGLPRETMATVRWRLRDDRTLTRLTGVLAASVVGASAINVVELFYIRDTLGASTTVFGLVAASWTGGMLIGTTLLSRLPRHRITVLAVLTAVAGSCLPALIGATVGTAYWLIPLWIVGGICNGGINVFVMVLVADRTVGAVRGRAFAAVNAAVQSAGIIGLLAAGPLVDQFSPRLLLAAAGATGVLAALACLPLVMRQERRAYSRRRYRRSGDRDGVVGVTLP